MQLETHLKWPITYQEKKCVCSGNVDYSFFVGDVNHPACQAKEHPDIGGQSQLLSYMPMVQANGLVDSQTGQYWEC
ncbi:hypothetical protein N7495_001885 [Penicillium taxi]|uniref:uncharacterized protein n=1 Tax=Penicillium taxi TaxID=168475 RepID=UPI0025451705|nr:uncharacterized protein N7495_001885 [Penicillium taxi]KAJ5909203.1 hypothetical protein N7495_001885 [Penicillium taxi]